ncbi:MAG: hypothetical protein Q8N94_08935 [Methanoregula sp.]|nr:hypothetical protein [Methanoregula sp.]
MCWTFVDETDLSYSPTVLVDDEPAPGTLLFTLKQGTLFFAVYALPNHD